MELGALINFTMSLTALKEQIQEVSKIAASMPEEFRQKCFELLMTHVLNSSGAPLPPLPHLLGSAIPFTAVPPAPLSPIGYSGAPPMTALLTAFVKKIGLTQEQFGRVLGYVHGNVVFYREPEAGKNNAQSQIDWALLLALKNAITQGHFIVDGEEVRLVCQEKGIFERRNFYPNFRKHADYFRSPPEHGGKPQPLSSKGIAALGQLVKRLAFHPGLSRA